jgi:hypothetical protein
MESRYSRRKARSHARAAALSARKATLVCGRTFAGKSQRRAAAGATPRLQVVAVLAALVNPQPKIASSTGGTIRQPAVLARDSSASGIVTAVGCGRSNTARRSARGGCFCGSFRIFDSRSGLGARPTSSISICRLLELEAVERVLSIHEAQVIGFSLAAGANVASAIRRNEPGVHRRPSASRHEASCDGRRRER